MAGGVLNASVLFLHWLAKSLEDSILAFAMVPLCFGSDVGGAFLELAFSEELLVLSARLREQNGADLCRTQLEETALFADLV